MALGVILGAGAGRGDNGGDWPPMKLTTREAGLHHVSASALAHAWGLPADTMRSAVAANRIALSNQGRPVGYLPDPDGSRFWFCAEAYRNNYTLENVYWLSPGSNVAVPSVEGGAPAAVEGSIVRGRSDDEFDALIRYELATDPDEDYWFWHRFVGSHPLLKTGRFDFVLPAMAAGAGPNRLVVRTMGGTAYGHSVSVEVNGCRDVAWRGNWSERVPFTLTADVPDSCLQPGTNRLTLQASGPSQSQWFLDSFSVEYWRACRAVDNVFEFESPAAMVLTVEGFSRPELILLDVTEPSIPKRVVNTTVDGQAGAWRLSVLAGSVGRRYVAFAEDAALPEPVIEPRPVAGWGGTAPRADLLVIAPANLVAAVEPLAVLRRSQGLEVAVAALESVFDEFNFGLREPIALQRLLSHAWRAWARPPAYVLLVGNGTYDYRNLQGHDDNALPPLMMATGYGLFAADTALGDVEGDLTPEIAVGRLPVTSRSQLERVIGKIIAYEALDPPALPTALFVADDPNQAGDFVQDLHRVAAEFGVGFQRDLVYPGVVSDVRSALIERLTAGIDWLCYVGHGSSDRLGSSGYLTVGDVAGLNNGHRLPVVLAMTCLVGQFAIPAFDTLGESLVLAPDAGAVAVVAPTGLSYNADAVDLNLEIAARLSDPTAVRLGDVLRLAMRQYNAAGPRLTPCALFQIIGDPALRIPRPPAPPPRLFLQAGEHRALRVHVRGVVGEAFRLWAADDIASTAVPWDEIAHGVLGDDGFVYIEAAADRPRRFYRVSQD